MVRVLVTDGMEKSAVEALKGLGYEVVEQFYEPEELKEQVKNFDAMVVRSATKVKQDILEAALETKKLKVVIRGGVGIDNIDKKFAEENGISVRNTPAASSASVAELTLGHMFNIARFMGDSNFTMRNGVWNKKKYEGTEIGGKTLGLIGFGRIAREVSKRAIALGMNVIYTDIFGELAGEKDAKFVDMETLIKSADYISLHIPKQADRPHVIGKEEIEKMKDGVFLVNCARGGLIDEAALLEALNSGKVAGAGLDVFAAEPNTNTELANHPHVSVTPHIGAATKEAQTRIGGEIVSIIEEVFNK